MKKRLIILITIFLIIIAFSVYFVINYRQAKVDALANNEEYIQYYNSEVLGSTVVTLINKAIDDNEKFGVEKDENENYIENDKNSIKIYVSFLDSEQNYTETFSMEKIYIQDTENFIKLYANTHFLCKTIEYHEETGLIKSITFEEVTN